MPSAAEVREQLTGPGGRSFERFVTTANGVGHALRDDADVGHGDRVAVLSQNDPEWCLAFWGTVDGGAILVGLLTGLKLVMPVGKFEPEDALAIIQDQQVNVWATVPTMVFRVCEHPDHHDYDTSSVRTVAFGGSPSAEELQRKVQDTFPDVATTSNAYGLTESSSVATVNSGEDAKRKPTSVGPPVPTAEIQVIDGAGNSRPAGEIGEICVKAPIIMKGYWNKPEATTGTVVQAEPGLQISEAEVKQWVADGLADFEVLAYVDIQADKLLPNASGKLLENALRGEAVVSFEETM